MLRITSALFAVMLLALGATGITIHVPGDYPTIQAGIDRTVDGDTVLVADGTYSGTGNRNIEFLGKSIVVMSENGAEYCTIDCESYGRGFNFCSSEDSTSVLSGFTIINGYVCAGAGIRCAFSSPTIQDCHIHDNTAFPD